MLRRKKDMNMEIRKNMRGGDGEITIINIINKDELKNARLLAYINIPIGSGIGVHEHKDETEYYIILNGKGQADDNGTLKEVQAGDVVITGGGASHSIKNIGDSELNMIAVIITQ